MNIYEFSFVSLLPFFTLCYTFKYSRCTDGLSDRQTGVQTEGNTISPFRNFVATGDKNIIITFPIQQYDQSCILYQLNQYQIV